LQHDFPQSSSSGFSSFRITVLLRKCTRWGVAPHFTAWELKNFHGLSGRHLLYMDLQFTVAGYCFDATKECFKQRQIPHLGRKVGVLLGRDELLC
jgi:hypothetical protein